jgi:hypothetical protein
LSEIIDAVTGMIEVIADNPASILIVLGFIAVLIAVLLPIGVSAQVVLGILGGLMLIGGIAVHVLWLQS